MNGIQKIEILKYMTEIRVLRLEDTKNTKMILKNIKNRVKDLLHNDIL